MRAAFVVLAFCLASVALAEPAVVVEVTGLAAPPLESSPSGPARAASEEAKAVMAQRCALCHGATGRSDGVMSSTLSPRPRDFSDRAWQRSVDDDHIRRAVLEGGAAVGRSAIMPANPDLKQKPAVVEQLIKLIRGFARRGVVRASVVAADGVVLAKSVAAPDDSGAKATVTLPNLKPGTVTVRGYFDVDENGRKDAGERTFRKEGVIVGDEPSVTVEAALQRAN